MKLFKFYTKTCCQCKVLDKMIEGFNLIPIIPVDCGEDPDDLTNKYQVRSLPTLILTTDDGEFIKRFTGIMTKDMLTDKLKEYEVN